jgi:hypothetical protein
LADSVTQVLDSLGLDLLAYLKNDKKNSGRKLRLTAAVYADPFWRRRKSQCSGW